MVVTFSEPIQNFFGRNLSALDKLNHYLKNIILKSGLFFCYINSVEVCQSLRDKRRSGKDNRAPS